MHDVLADLPFLVFFHLFDMGIQSRFILLPICHNCILDDFQTVVCEATVVLGAKTFQRSKQKSTVSMMHDSCSIIHGASSVIHCHGAS